MTDSRRPLVAMICGPAPPCRDGVSDYVAHLVEALADAAVDAVPVPVRPRGPRGWPRATLDVGRALRRLRPHVVHVQFAPSTYRFSPLPGLLPVLLPRGVPLVTTVHEYGWWAAPAWVPTVLWRGIELARLWDRETGLLVPASAAVIVTNRAHAREVLGRTGRRTVEIPLAPNVVGGGTDSAVRPAVRRRLGLAPGSTLLVFFGFVHPVKGVRYLLEALPALRAERPDVHVAVVGGFVSAALPGRQARAFRSELEQVAQRCGVADAVTFTEHLPAPEVSRFLRAADAAVLPFTAGVTLKSGALLATLAHGVPTAVTLPDESDGVLRDGENVAVIAHRRDPAAVAATLRRLLDDAGLRRRLAAAGPRLTRDRSWARVAAAHREVYEAVRRRP